MCCHSAKVRKKPEAYLTEKELFDLSEFYGKRFKFHLALQALELYPFDWAKRRRFVHAHNR